MNRTLETKEYRFNEARHLHELFADGAWKSLTGCTTILSVLAKPALIQWSANMAVDYIYENISELITAKRERQDEILKEAKSAHRKKKELAGNFGTEVHAWIEKFIKGEKPEPLEDENKELACGNFVKWVDDNKVKFFESEKCLYSKKHWLGGIVDIVCEIDGQIWIADIKTGSGIYFEAFWQMAGYQIMLEEMGFDKPITGHIVLNLKKDGSFQEKRSVSNEDNKKGFMACLEIYRIQEKIKNQIIN
jgi:hypothetical protein